MKALSNLRKIVLVALCAVNTAIADTPEVMCATVEVIECVSAHSCIKTSSVAVAIPSFLRINFEDRVISGKRVNGDDLKADIKSVHRTEEGVLLQGIDEGLGWSMTLTEADGSMSLAVSGDLVGYVIFGNCTAL